MSKYEKVGSFLLFDKVEEDKLSKSYIAGQIVNNQIQSVCLVKKFDHSLSTMPDFILDLNQEYETMKGLSNPNIIRPNAFVQDKSEFAAIFDYVEGKSLRAILNRCASDSYPFTVDHSLLIASRLCTALEYIHSKKVNEQRLIHGFVSPETIHVTYDGEIKLQYLGLAHALLKFPAGRDKFFHDYKNYIAPELLNQQKWEKGADIFATGAVLFEMLNGESLFAKGRNINIDEAIEGASMNTGSGDRVALPEEIKKLLHQALSVDPAMRFASIADMRKALDLLLFSSEFSPTTFNLAFFMHSLFRESIDEENKNMAGYKKIDIASFVKEEPPAPVKVEHPVGASPAKDIPPIPVTMERNSVPSFSQPEFMSITEEKGRSKAPLFLGILVALAVVGGIVFFALRPSTPVQTAQQPGAAPQQPALTPEQLKAQEAEHTRLQEEASKAQEDAKKKDEELKALQAKLDAMVKAQEDAAKKAARENAAGNQNATTTPAVDTAAIKKLQEEAKRLEEEKKQQEALAEQKKKEVELAAAAQQQQQQQAQAQPNAQAPATTTPTTTNPEPNPSTPITENAVPDKPEVKEGQEVELTPDVVKPEITNRVNPSYPPIAQKNKVEGTVIVSVLVSETGDPLEAKVLRGAGGSSGLNEAAIASVKKWRFRPAVKEGKRVRVWMTYPIVFKLQ